MSDIWKKLNLKDQTGIIVVAAPESFEPEISALSDVTVARKVSEAKQGSFFLVFVTERMQIEKHAKAIVKMADGDAVVWFAYPKGTSKRYKCDFNRDSGWEPLGAAGFEGVRQVAIDEDWSALRFRRKEFIKTMKRDPKSTLTKKGKTGR